MANKTKEDLTAKTTPETGDLFDLRTPTDAASDKDHKILWENLLAATNAGALSNYRIPIASKDISAGNQDNDVSGYEASAYDKKIIEIGATGGTGSFTCTLTTGTYTVGGIAASAWDWKGGGRLHLLVDVPNTNFIPLGPYVWDRGNFSTGIFKKFLDGYAEVSYEDTALRTCNSAAGGGYVDASARTYNFPITFSAPPHISDRHKFSASALISQMRGTAQTTTQVTLQLFSTNSGGQGYNGYGAFGKWTSNADSIVVG